MRGGVALFAAFLMMGCMLASHVSAEAIGVNKAVMNFPNVLKNGYAQTSVYVSTDSKENLSLHAEFSGTIARWAKVTNEGPIYISKNHGKNVYVAIEPPGDVQNGVYEGILRLRTSPLPRSIEGRIGSSIVASFAIQIRVTVVGDEIVSCIPGGYDVPDVELGEPLEIGVLVSNTGNVQILPEVLATIWDQQQKEVLYSEQITLDKRILPTTSERFHAVVPELSLAKGQYWISLSIPMCDDEPLLKTFNVVERGEIADTGVLMRIENPYVADVGEVVSIRGIFKNYGERMVTAKFKGTIRKGNTAVKVFESDELDVEPSRLGELEVFFEPDEPGKYEVVGRVLYNNKLTYEKNSILNVNPTDEYLKREEQRITLLSYIQLGILLLAILFLLIIIQRKRRSRRRARL